MNTMSEGPLQVVCLPVGVGVPIAGASLATCDQCHRDIWVAPSTLKLIAEFMSSGENTFSLWCIPCARVNVDRQQDAGEDITMHPITEDQRDELKRELGG